MSVDGAPPEPQARAEAVAIRVAMPSQLRDLAKVRDAVVLVEVAPPVTLAAVLDALEATHPTLVGTIRDRATGARRPMIRIYAEGEDLSDVGGSTVLPSRVIEGREPLRLVGSIAGG